MLSPRNLRFWAAGLALGLGWVHPEILEASEAKVPVEVFELDNGMRFLLVPRPELTTVATGWVAHVGSAHERPGITGLAHLFEHMLFKGTHTLGTRDLERDLEVIAEQEAVQEELREHYAAQRARWRRGEIDDPYDAAATTLEMSALEAEFERLVGEQRELMVKDEFDKIYTQSGATGMNAFTSEDLTAYFVTLPANKLELWFWMESDRLAEPVFREFYSERDVVHEERRLRTESTPTGRFDELLEAMFWQSHPYSWPVVGWPSDLRVISKAQADEFFATYYAPNNLTAALVGNFDPAVVRAQAERYFGRLKRGPAVPDVVTLEMPQVAEKRMRAECDCQPQVSVLYHTVPFRHRDGYALEVLAGLLNGRTGRLYKSLVLDQQIATSAAAGQDGRRYGGVFQVSIEAKGEASPLDLEAAWYGELTRLQEEPVPSQELQKVKNQIAANAFRRLESPFFLMLQLVVYDGLSDWTYLNDWADLTGAVTAEDVQRVARTYFDPENRVVGEYRRKEGLAAAVEPSGLEALPPEARSVVEAQLRQIRGAEESGPLNELLAGLESALPQAESPRREMMSILIEAVQARLAELAETKPEGAAP